MLAVSCVLLQSMKDCAWQGVSRAAPPAELRHMAWVTVSARVSQAILSTCLSCIRHGLPCGGTAPAEVRHAPLASSVPSQATLLSSPLHGVPAAGCWPLLDLHSPAAVLSQAQRVLQMQFPVMPATH